MTQLLLIARASMLVTSILASYKLIKVVRLAKAHENFANEFRAFVVFWAISLFLLNAATLILKTPIDEYLTILLGTVTMGLLGPCLLFIYAKIIFSKKNV